MASKAAVRQANYREYFARATKQVEEALANQDPAKRQAYVEDFQQRMDMMFTSVPSIADSWQQFVVAANEVTYRMTVDDPDIPRAAKDAFVAEHREYLRKSQKNWPAVVIVLLIVLIIVVVIVLIATGAMFKPR
ncbi:MAG: hypothetical protein IJG88_00830 [Eggerthellaceae bacterium]|nr:hypothetical protein [Eggerthellaceae bacterium]